MAKLHDAQVPPRRLLLLKEGDIGWSGLDGYVLDKAAADRIVSQFSSQGNKILIDWEHADEDVRRKVRDKAPAAGWIDGMEYVEGEGLYGTVSEWTPEAAKAITNHTYKYISPVITHDENKAILTISSVAMTNTPRTRFAPELGKMKDPSKGRKAAKDGVPAATVELGKDDDVRRLLADLESPDDFPAMSSDMKAISDLAAALKAKGVQVAEDASLATIIQAAIEAIGSDGEGEGAADAAGLKTLTAKLGITAASVKGLGDQIAALKVKASSYDKLASEVEMLRAERASARVDSLIDQAIEDGKLNPNDEEGMKAARKLAESDEATFKTLVGSLVGVPTGSVVRGDAKGKPSGNPKREDVIRVAAKQWHEEAKHVCGQKAYVDQFLDANDLQRLTKTEIEKLSEIV